MVFDGIEGSVEGYSPLSPLDIQDMYVSSFGIPQSDIDWVMGASSSCPKYPSFSLVDHADTIGTGTAEHIVTVTLDDAGDWSTLLPEGYNNGWGDDYGYYECLPYQCERYNLPRRRILPSRLLRHRH